MVTSEAVLYPLAQSAIVPKISAPIKAFYVNRGSKVHAGQLLATLENRDLAAAAQDNQGAYARPIGESRLGRRGSRQPGSLRSGASGVYDRDCIHFAGRDPEGAR